MNPNVFLSVNKSECTLKVPMSSVSAYQNADIWKEFNIEGIEVGIETNETDIVNVYPNPTIGELKIESGELKINNIEIFDMGGKSHPIQKTGCEEVFDISHLLGGLYFLRITTEKGAITRKILKVE